MALRVRLPTRAERAAAAAPLWHARAADAQPAAIVPGRLLLGARHHATPAMLARHGVSLVVSVLERAPSVPASVRQLHVPVRDGGCETFLRRGGAADPPQDRLRDVAAAIHGHLRASDAHCVLVHCQAGVSRSATVVMAYLLLYRADLLAEPTARAAQAYVAQRRPQADPCLVFYLELLRLERELREAVVPTD